MSMLTIAIPQFVENLRKNIQGVETTEELLIEISFPGEYSPSLARPFAAANPGCNR